MSAIIDNNAIQAIFAQPAPDGAFEGDYLKYLRSIGGRRTILFLAFAPKVAGTFFRQAAMHAVNGDLYRTSHAQGGRDGVPYLPNLLACYLDKELRAVVVHIHMQAFAANRHLMSAFGIRPVIMLRNIPDALASFWDMLESDPVARAQCLNCVVPDNFVELSRAQKADFVVDIIAPWYASYFASWKSFADETPEQLCVLRYGDFCRDPAQAIHQAVAHAGFAASQGDCAAAVERVWQERDKFRYNKGAEGRGKSYFSASQLAEISRKLSHYPQLEAWLPDLMASANMEAKKTPRLSLAAS
jgi:hypothetical protein